jgi:uncharacterized protein DUF6941
MASPIQAKLILCDAAVADPTGKVHMLGAGWSVTTSPTAPQAVAVLVKIPWDRTNQKIPIDLSLVDADGHPVVLDTPQGVQPVQSTSELEVGRPAGMAPGSMIDASFALTVQPMPLAPGRYEWRLTLGEFEESESFQVRGPSPR